MRCLRGLKMCLYTLGRSLNPCCVSFFGGEAAEKRHTRDFLRGPEAPQPLRTEFTNTRMLHKVKCIFAPFYHSPFVLLRGLCRRSCTFWCSKITCSMRSLQYRHSIKPGIPAIGIASTRAKHF